MQKFFIIFNLIKIYKSIIKSDHHSKHNLNTFNKLKSSEYCQYRVLKTFR